MLCRRRQCLLVVTVAAITTQLNPTVTIGNVTAMILVPLHGRDNYTASGKKLMHMVSELLLC